MLIIASQPDCSNLNLSSLIKKKNYETAKYDDKHLSLAMILLLYTSSVAKMRMQIEVGIDQYKRLALQLIEVETKKENKGVDTKQQGIDT